MKRKMKLVGLMMVFGMTVVGLIALNAQAFEVLTEPERLTDPSLPGGVIMMVSATCLLQTQILLLWRRAMPTAWG